jgi:hypothetical protein
MSDDILCILNQIAEAKQRARSYGKPVYAYWQDGQWYFGGKVPEESSRYYVAYPDGDLDQSPLAPKITEAEWAEFRKLPDADANCWPSGKKPFCAWPMAWRAFLCYCAFAPYCALAFVANFLFSASVNFWDLAFFSAITCVPLSIVFSLAALYKPKAGAMAAAISMMASDAHMLFYAHLYILSVTNQEQWFAWTLTASLLMSGISYLFLMDNRAATA